MNDEIQRLKIEADKAKFLYARCLITREECRQMVVPYINAFNLRSKEIAKKYNVKPKFINFVSYIR